MVDKRILMIINEFPPVGESGVQRPLKFVKYLSKLGWKVWVVTPRRLPKGILDPSLCDEIPKDCSIHYTGSFGLGAGAIQSVDNLRTGTASPLGKQAIARKALLTVNNILFPLDKQIGWVPFAYRKAVQIIEQHKLRNVYITGFPFSAFLAGIMLKRKFDNKIRWIADYRDAWQFEPLMAGKLPPFRMNQIRYWDEKTLKSCDHAVFVTQGIVDQYIKAYPWLRSKCSLITNGYDEDDFAAIEPIKCDKYNLVYMGKLYNLQRPNILPLLEALKSIDDGSFHLTHVGTSTPEVDARIQEGSYSFYHYEGYQPHQIALNYSAGADVNLLPINDDPASRTMFTGKLFELLRIGKPILALGPDQCVAGDLVKRARAGEYVNLADREGIVSALERIKNNPAAYKTDKSVVREYERERLAGRLAMLYE